MAILQTVVIEQCRLSTVFTSGSLKARSYLRGCGPVVFFIFGLPVCLPPSHVPLSGCSTLQITVKASASLKFWPLCVRWLLVTGTWSPSRSVAVMEAEAGAPTVNCAPCPGPFSIRRCVLLDLGTPLMEEVSHWNIENQSTIKIKQCRSALFSKNYSLTELAVGLLRN